MIEKLYQYTLDAKDLFENVVNDENVMINHVVIESGKTFPKHKTDAIVYIIIIKGTLNITIDTQEDKKFKAGDVIHIPYNVDSLLGNKSEDTCEVFVVKINPNK